MDDLYKAKGNLIAFTLRLESSGTIIAPEVIAARKVLQRATPSKLLNAISELAALLDTFVSITDKGVPGEKQEPEPEYGCGEDFPLVQAEVLADDTICSYLMDCRPWLIQQDDDNLYRLLENDGGPGQLTDGIHYEFGYCTEGGRELDAYLKTVNPPKKPEVGFSVEVNVDQLAEWLHEFRPTVVENWEDYHA